MAARGQAAFGFLIFFVLSLGLGLPYLFLGAFSGSISQLPRAGEWMEGVKKIFGWVLLATMLFFSSLAFTVLENAMSVIFFHRVAIRRRRFLVSALLPYCYILLLGVGLLLVLPVLPFFPATGEPTTGIIASVVALSSPLTTITGICWVLLETRRRLSTSIPVPPGILISRRIRSGLERRAIIHACRASTVKMTSNFFGSKKDASICR